MAKVIDKINDLKLAKSIFIFCNQNQNGKGEGDGDLHASL